MPDKPPPDPADHAEEFAHRWSDKLDQYSAERMEALGVPTERIGSSDHKHGIPWAAFNPNEREAGGVDMGGRINVDSGVLNPTLMKPVGPDASTAWEKARLRDRIDAAIAHEYEEGNTGSHDLAVEQAPDTALPISHEARELARRIREAVRGR